VSRGPDPVFFPDRNLGRTIVPNALRKAGVAVEVMDDQFPPDTPDKVRGDARVALWVPFTED
jgi:hypothetical protein